MTTLMDKLRQMQTADYDLESATLAVFGDDDTPEALDKLWFKDWYFDTYDSSIELLEAVPGATPTSDQLEQLHALGLETIYISYTDGIGFQWYHRDNAWHGGACSPRHARRNLSALLRKTRQELQDCEKSSEMFANNLRRTAEALGKPTSGKGSSWHDIPDYVTALRNIVTLATTIAMKRPRDGSQLDADLEEVLLLIEKLARLG